MAVNYEVRFATNPTDAKSYDTQRLREEFLVENVMEDGKINLVYSHYDRMVVGGAVPIKEALTLQPIEPQKADYFCERSELGVINVGGKGSVLVDGTTYNLDYKEALYVGRGNREIVFQSADAGQPAHFYLNSAPAHKECPVKKISLKDAEVLDLGSQAESNERRINKLIVNSIVETCQLQMGMTELKPGSVWNTMPCHTHDRRMEAYFYFEVPENQAVCHLMGQPKETRHIWMHNQQAVLSPPWSIHSAAGTSNYIFIWGMAGQNLDYTDMDKWQPTDIK